MPKIVDWKKRAVNAERKYAKLSVAYERVNKRNVEAIVRAITKVISAASSDVAS